MKRIAAGLGPCNNEAASLTPLLVKPVLNFSPAPREHHHSTKNPQLWELCRTVQGFLASGQAVDELFLEAITPEYRYRKGDIIKSLRMAHRTHRETTRMGLVQGIWRVCPATIAGTCSQYECQSRLVCRGGRP